MSVKRLSAVLIIGAVATSACGSTVSTGAAQQSASGASGLESNGNTNDLTRDAAGAVDAPSTSTPSSASDSGTVSGAEPTTTGEPGGSNIGNGSAASPPTPSVARGPIKIGALTLTKASNFQASLGFKGATGDQVAMTKSVVNYINTHGGLGGRKIQLVSYDLDPTSFTSDASSAMQKACTYFTQDNKVVALSSYVSLVPENFYECLAKAHVPVVTPDEGVSADFMRRYANTVYMPASPTYTRLLTDSVDALWDAGWLTSKSVVGIVSYDTNDAHSIVDKGLAPALKKHGLKITAGMYTATSADAASEYTSGALSFKSRKVDRVFFAPGGQPIYFALAAEQQAYHPYYEMGSLEYPTPVADNIPADQLKGSMGLGWLPYLDLPPNAWTSVTTPGITECRAAMKEAAQDFTSGTTLGIATWICDDWMLWRKAFGAGASTDEVGIRRAVESLGNTFEPAATFGTALSPSRAHDGAADYRLLAFQSACGCYRYTSNVRTLK